MVAVGSAVYLVFVTNFFRTTVSFHTPWERYLQSRNGSDYLRHAVDTGRCERKICAFGRDVGILAAALLVLREDAVHSALLTRNQAWYASIVAWAATMLGGLALNLNFTVYLMPVAAVDLGMHTIRKTK